MSIMGRYRDEYLTNFGNKYQNHVNKFIEYLRIEGKLDTPTMINLVDVDKCIGMYSKSGKINYRATMASHLESVKSFYAYLNQNGKANDIFTQFNYEEFKNELFTKYLLSEGKEREIFSSEIIEEILTKLEDLLKSDYNNMDNDAKMKKYNQRMVLRIYIKLVLIAPAKKKTICNIKLKDFDKDFRNVVINKVLIQIPNSLRRDIFHAIKFVEETRKTTIKEDTKILQYLCDNKTLKENMNYWFCTFLKDTEIIDIEESKTTYSLEPLMKTVISNMVSRMANPAIISKISGITIASLEKTYYSSDKMVMEYRKTIDQAVNWEISKCDYYNYI